MEMQRMMILAHTVFLYIDRNLLSLLRILMMRNRLMKLQM